MLLKKFNPLMFFVERYAGLEVNSYVNVSQTLSTF